MKTHSIKGPESWCKYERAVAKGEEQPKHQPSFKHDILPVIYPIILRLIDRDLLKRCSRMKTENANESFNAAVWRRCPKTEFRGKASIETAVALATLEFNHGGAGITKLLEEMNLQTTAVLRKHLIRKIAASVKASRASTKRLSKFKRKALKLIRLTKNQQRIRQEGMTYQAGGFNSVPLPQKRKAA